MRIFCLACLLGLPLLPMLLGEEILEELRSISSAFSKLVKNPLFPHLPEDALCHCSRALSLV